jgi:Zn-dependent peptidase ImmA (M78 family)
VKIVCRQAMGEREGSGISQTLYQEPRAHALRERYLALFGGADIPVPVESIAEDFLGLRIEQAYMDCSGMLLPAQRLIRINAAEGPRNEAPMRRFRFTIAHELGHWICHAVEGAEPAISYCRAIDLTESADRSLEREANVFAAELLMPEGAVRASWAELQSPDALASRFDVSPTAMRWRLYSFGLTSAPSTDDTQSK